MVFSISNIPLLLAFSISCIIKSLYASSPLQYISSAIRPPNSTNRDIAIPQLPVTPGNEIDNGSDVLLAFIFVTEEKMSQYPIPLENKLRIVTRAPLFAKCSY